MIGPRSAISCALTVTLSLLFASGASAQVGKSKLVNPNGDDRDRSPP